MRKTTADAIDHTTLETSLRRLGIVELEKRLEISPLLAAGGQSGGGTTSCPCRMPNGGDGSTGPVDGGLTW